MSFHEHGACKGADPNLFFPEDNGRGAEAQANAAKAICATCSVREECLDDALLRKEAHGIWGGLTPAERKRILRAMKQAS